MNERYDILFLAPMRERTGGVGITCYGHRCLSAYLYKESGITSRILGGTTEESYRLIQKDVLPDPKTIVGFFTVQDNYPIVKHMIRYLHKNGIRTIIGGPHSLEVDEAEIRSIGVDYVIDGEGEKPLNSLMRFLVLGEGSDQTIPGLRFVDSGGVYHNTGPGEMLSDLDEVGFFNEDWDLTSSKDTRILHIMTGRGCPNRCSFCYEGNVRRLRLRSVENVLEEIDSYRTLHPELVCIGFLDDTFSIYSDRVHRFCVELKKRSLRWICEIHAAKLYQEPQLLDEMLDAGLLNAQIGIESGSAQVLKAYKKNTTPDMLLSVVERFGKQKKADLEGNFILGGAFETKETLEESIRLGEQMIMAGKGIIRLSAVYFAPYERTVMTTHPEDFGMELYPEYMNCTVDSMKICVNRTRALSREEIQEGKQEFDRRMQAAYRKAVQLLTREELEMLLNRPNGSDRIRGPWKRAIQETEYVSMYLHRGRKYHSFFDPDAVPLRTFNDLNYRDGRLAIGPYLFEGMEKRLLEMATGSHTFRELSEMLQLSVNELYTLYSSLRDRLLIYMEMF